MDTKNLSTLRKAFYKLNISNEISFNRFLVLKPKNKVAKKSWFIKGKLTSYRRINPKGIAVLVTRRPRIVYKGKQEPLNRIFIDFFKEDISGNDYKPNTTNVDMNPWHWEIIKDEEDEPIVLEKIAHRVIDNDIEELVEHIKLCGYEGLEDYYTPLEIERARELLENN